MLKSYDDRRDVAILSNLDTAIQFAAKHWIECARTAIEKKGRFAVALSGGGTPKPIFKLLSSAYRTALDWSKVWLFWSDERAVDPTHADSNYGAAMTSGFQSLPIPSHQIFRMKAESNIESEALAYEQTIQHFLGKDLFDLVMLGIGEDGHTASLFPDTAALDVSNRLVAANYLPKQSAWRMTLTFDCINQSHLAVFYVFGASKSEIVKKILESPLPSPWPSSRIGTSQKKSLWILDRSAATRLVI